MVSRNGKSNVEQLAFWQESVESSILRGYVLMLWFHQGGTIPITRDETIYTIIMSTLPTGERAWAKGRSGYETLDLTEQESTYLQEYAYHYLIEACVQNGEVPALPQLCSQVAWDDDPTEGCPRSKPKKKASKSELEAIVTTLRVELELERFMQSFRWNSLRVRDLGYYLEVCEKAMIRLAVRVAELEGHEYVPSVAYPAPNRNCYLCGTDNWEWRGYCYHCITCKAEPTDIEDMRGKCASLSQENRRLRERLLLLEGKEKKV